MESKCPICNSVVPGTVVSAKESSLMRSWYKLCYSIIVPIPLIGAYLGGKIHNIMTGFFSTSYSHLCPKCKCHWIDTIDTEDVKISGNKKLMAIFCGDTFIVGIIDKNLYTIQTQMESHMQTTVVFQHGNVVNKNVYYDGLCKDSTLSFGQSYVPDGLYIGELNNAMPHGWGFVYAKNGHLNYGKWNDGKKNGIMYSVSLNGDTSNVEYWRDGVLVDL